jgi:hypothetical protein
MLKAMVATTRLATMVSLIWVGALALVLVIRALVSWLAFRSATRSAARAKEIAEATAPLPAEAHSAGELGRVIPLRGVPTSSQARSEAEG